MSRQRQTAAIKLERRARRTRLERRYRTLLRLLPRWYRAEREEEMVGTFLAGRRGRLDREYGWPGWSEALAVAALATRTRLAGRGAPRAVAAGDTARLIALVGLLLLAVEATVTLVQDVGSLLELRRMLRTGAPNVFAGAEAGPSELLLPLIRTLGWGAAFTMLAGGRRTLAKAAATVPLGLTLADLIRYPPDGAAGLGRWLTGNLLVLVVLACLYAGHHRDAPAPTARPWLRAGAVAGVLAVSWGSIGAIAIMLHHRPLESFFALAGVPSAVAMAIGGVGYLVVAGLRGSRSGGDRAGRFGAGSWPLALGCCAGLLLLRQLTWLSHGLPAGALKDASVRLVIGTAVCLLAVAIALAVDGVREYRRLPATQAWLSTPRRRRTSRG